MVLFFFFINNQIPKEIQSTISLLLPFIIIAFLFIMPKKEREGIEKITSDIKQTKIGKAIMPIVFVVLIISVFIVVYIESKYPPVKPVAFKLWTAQSGMLKKTTDHHSVVAYLNNVSCSTRLSSFS